MKKRIMAMLLAVLTVFATVGLVACGGDDPTSMGGGISTPAEKTYTVTFKQKDCDDVVKTVKEGETLTDVPQPQEKKGYTVTWETVDLTNVRQNITVNAVESPNEYTITYILNNDAATISATEQDVLYDSEVTLLTPSVNVEDDLAFQYWVITGTETIFKSGKYQVDSNISLTAVWGKSYSKDY